MPLPNLLNVPSTLEEWRIWEFSHRDNHQIIRQAIQAKSNNSINLFEYQLYPIPFDNIDQWLEANQQSHDDFNQALSLQGVDLEGVDFTDKNQLQSWVYLHWFEHQTACLELGIS